MGLGGVRPLAGEVVQPGSVAMRARPPSGVRRPRTAAQRPPAGRRLRSCRGMSHRLGTGHRAAHAPRCSAASELAPARTESQTTSSVRETIRVVGRPRRMLGNGRWPARSDDRRYPRLSVVFQWCAAPPRPQGHELGRQSRSPADPCSNTEWPGQGRSPRTVVDHW
jgi:hypothetical protein